MCISGFLPCRINASKAKASPNNNKRSIHLLLLFLFIIGCVLSVVMIPISSLPLMNNVVGVVTLVSSSSVFLQRAAIRYTSNVRHQDVVIVYTQLESIVAALLSRKYAVAKCKQTHSRSRFSPDDGFKTNKYISTAERNKPP